MTKYYPQTVEQWTWRPSIEIPWYTTPQRGENFLNNCRWTLTKDLYHIINSATGDLRSRTYAILCTNLGTNFTDPINGIQVTVIGQRNGRVADHTMQLMYQGKPYGDDQIMYYEDNDGHYYINNLMTYGGPCDLWGAEITPEIVNDPSFGVKLRWQSHPLYPHKCGASVDKVFFEFF